MKQALQLHLTWPVYGVVRTLNADGKIEKNKTEDLLQEWTFKTQGEAVQQYYKTLCILPKLDLY